MKNFIATILANELITDQYYWMAFETKEKFKSVLPGQFLHILCRDHFSTDPLLRRPISICRYHEKKGLYVFEIIYKISGRGTALLAKMREGDYIDVLGPLGNHFRVDKKVKNAAIIGGGVGVPPLIFLADLLDKQKGLKYSIFIGGKSANDLLCKKDIERLGADRYFSTEDGSVGFEGLITDCFTKELNSGKKYDVIYACGPTPMLKAIQKIGKEENIQTELSMEEHMGCGLGACLSCAVNTTDGIKRVCKDGPVFNGNSLKWDWRDERVNLLDNVRAREPVYNTDLTVDLGKLRLRNPIITGSGTFGYGEEFLELIDMSHIGGISVKGITLRARQGNRQQRLVETPAGILNTIGLQNYGIDEFIAKKLPVLKSYDTAIIVNISGERVEEYAELAGRLNDAEGISAIEINISCPNVDEGCMEFGKNPSMAAKVVEAVRKNTDYFCIVKLSPNVTDIAQIARACEDHGADCFSLVNTFLGMSIDHATAMPRLGRLMGGLSGPAIKPLAVRMVWQLYENTELPIIGMGGIMGLQDALEFVFAGSKVISLGTANFIHPKIAMDIVGDLTEYLIQERIAKFEDIVGLSHGVS